MRWALGGGPRDGEIGKERYGRERPGRGARTRGGEMVKRWLGQERNIYGVLVLSFASISNISGIWSYGFQHWVGFGSTRRGTMGIIAELCYILGKAFDTAEYSMKLSSFYSTALLLSGSKLSACTLPFSWRLSFPCSIEPGIIRHNSS